MQNIQSPLQTIYKASNDSLLDTLIPNEVLGIIFDRVVNPDYSSKHISSILFTCKKWKSVLQKNPCISLVQALFQLNGSHHPSTISHLQECLTTENESFTSQELKLIDLANDNQRFEQLLMVDSKLFHPKSLFLSLLDRCPWNPEFCTISANKNIQLVAEEQLSILNSLIFGTDEQRLTVIENDSIAKLYRGASRSATWRQAKTSVISTLKKFPNFNDKKIFIQVARCFGRSVFDIHESLKKDREIVLACVQRRGRTLRNADESLKKDRDIILAAVKQNGQALRYADGSLKKDQEIVLAAVKQNGNALQFVDESLKKDQEIVLAAVNQDGTALVYADESLKKDREIVLAAVKQSGDALFYADASLRKDREIVLAAVQQEGNGLQYAGKSLKKDREIVLAAVNQVGLALEYADASLRKDREIVLAAVNQVGWGWEALRYAHKSLKKDREIVLAAIKQSAGALQYADKSLKKDREIVLAAVKQEGLALEYADVSLKKNREIVLAALKQNDRALEYVSLALRIELALTSLLQTPKNYISDLALYSVWHL